MEEPLTEDMLAELLDAPDPRAFIKRREVGERSLAEYLNALLAEKGLKRAAVVREAGINETFGYQIFTGARGASRDKLLALCFALGLTLTEANRLLKACLLYTSLLHRQAVRETVTTQNGRLPETDGRDVYKRQL